MTVGCKFEKNGGFSGVQNNNIRQKDLPCPWGKNIKLHYAVWDLNINIL
jgi:hypothetical protein